MLPSSDRRACIIGAGSSGIAAAQVLDARGIPFDCFEMGSGVGGNWRYGNDNGVSSAYRSLHINTSRHAMEYAAYPMPESLPDYPSHWQIADYFDDFVDHFGLREKITFRTEVVKVEPAAQGGYDVTVRPIDTEHQPETRHYEHVLVANGHHWDPRWPEPSFPGSETFPGTQLHAHYYRTPDVLEGKRVVVLGIGNSATDIAVESSRVAEGDLPGDASRRLHRAEVHVRPADRPPHRLPAGARAVPAPEAGDGADAAALGRQGDRLRPARSPTTTCSRRTRRSVTTC